MRILDRYILKSILSIFFTCLFTFLFLYIIIDIFSYLEDIIKQKVGIQALIMYYVGYLPIVFVQVAPFSCLLATLYTFAKFNRDNEIIAMRASGLSIVRVSKTVIVFGLLISVIVFWASDRLVPAAMTLNQKLKYDMADKSRKEREAALQQNTIMNLAMYGVDNRLFFINKFDPPKKLIEGIIILEQDQQQNITRKIVANSGIYKDSNWVFYQCITYNFDKSGQVKGEPEYFDEQLMPIPETPEDFLSHKQSPEYMTIAQLKDYLNKLSKSGATTVVRRLKVDLYQRYFSPLLSFMIVLLGIPFSLKMHRRATGLSSIGISILLGFFYYVLNAVCIAFGKSGLLPPLLSASLSHIIAFVTAVFFIRKLP